ncbi:MAG: type IX secretion system protein PorQ [Chitinophagales bacterium]|nr:type IX secretion system protein PorQ [Chitinophagales bacterium]
MTIGFFMYAGTVFAQTLGGNTVFNFLKLSNSPQLTALGGVNVSKISDDIGLAVNNPALLQPSMHTQMSAVFNSFYAGIKAYGLSLGYQNEKVHTNFLWSLNYFSYGNIQQTDALGNVLGSLQPTDWVMQVSASRKYMEKWNYGATLKFINSNYGIYRANGIALDVGVLYYDSAKLFSASMLARNMGFQLKKYAGTEAQDLPFDLELGLSKRLENAPFGFSFTAHHLHQFDIRYSDTSFNNENGFSNGNSSKFSLDKIFRHFVFATDIYLGDKVEVNVGYNYLKRQELNIGNSGNGLTGFSMGVALLLKKLQVRYALAAYQNNTTYSQFGLNMKLNEYFGLGKFGEKIGW